MIKSLPEEQRDTYLSWDDFNRVLENADWLRDLLVLLYYTGMRFGEAVNLRWEMYKPDRRMLILPPSATKEGKNGRTAGSRQSVCRFGERLLIFSNHFAHAEETTWFKPWGLVFGYGGNFKNRSNTYQGKPIDRSMVRKCWHGAIARTGLNGTPDQRFAAHVEDQRPKIGDASCSCQRHRRPFFSSSCGRSLHSRVRRGTSEGRGFHDL